MSAVATLGKVPVTALRHYEPDIAPMHVELPDGLTIAEIVGHVMPGLSDAQQGRLRVILVTPRGEVLIHQDLWTRVRPHAGVHVVLRLVAGKGTFKSILLALVSIAAAALTGPIAGLLAPALGITSSIGIGVLKAGITLALTMAGGLLINALLPKDEKEDEKPAYLISGFRNRFTPNQPVPDPMGRIRIAPPFAASSWTEVVGDYLYARALFLIGYGPVEISDLKLGDTPVSDYDEVQYEIKNGYPEDTPQTLYVSQVVEVSQGVDVTYLNERDDYGNPISNTRVTKPVKRFTATDATGAGILLSFPMGLMRIDDEGEEHAWPVDLDISYRKAGDVAWTDTDGFHLERKTKDGFFRLFRIEFPTRGRYEIRVTRTSAEERDPADYAGVSYLARCTWVALQSYRPEYPLNFGKPIALVGMRVKATSQLNGTIDNFNCIAEPLRRDWNAGTATWIVRKTKNPASYAIHSLQGVSNAFPVADEEIDWPAFQDWHVFCASKGLIYNRMHDFDAELAETLSAIGAAGRAAIIHDGAKWTVVIDRPREIVAAHISRRNMRDFRWQTSFFQPPDALRVPFLDETADFQAAERVIPWPVDLRFATQAILAANLGHAAGTEAEVYSDVLDLNNGIWVKSGGVGTGSWEKKVLLLTEQLELPGNTDPYQIFIATRRRQHEIMLRASTFSGVQMGNIRTATRGDLIMAARDVIRTVSHSARVRSVSGSTVLLDDEFEMVDGESYAIRFRIYPADVTDYSVLRSIATHPGRSRAVYMTDTGEDPPVGAVVHFGPSGQDSIPLILAAVERGSEDSSVLHLVPAAPEIDTKTDAEIPYPWSGRTGPIYTDLSVPAAPRISRVLTGFVGTGDSNGILVSLEPGTSSTAIIASYRLYHRLVGAGSWSGPLTCDAGAASIDVPGYTLGNMVELQPQAVAIGGIVGPLGTVITIEVGNDDVDVPLVLPSATVTGGLGHAAILFTTGPDPNTEKVQIYTNTTGVAPTPADRLGPPIPVTPNQSYPISHGDPTATNILASGAMATNTWFGANWVYSTGKYTHTPGATTQLVHPVFPAQAAGIVRVAYTVSARTAGTVASWFGNPVIGGTANSANGRFRQKMTLGAGVTQFRFSPASAFDGAVENVTVFFEKPGSIAEGTRYYWFDPINSQGQAGPRSAVVAEVD